VASGVSFAPAGNVAATNVQGAIAEVDAEKVAKSGDVMTGNLKISVADNALGLLVNGATTGVRFVAGPGGISIEGVDNSGVGSYQPLNFYGSVIKFNQAVTLIADPAAPLEAATKQYVDNTITARIGHSQWDGVGLAETRPGDDAPPDLIAEMRATIADLAARVAVLEARA
jgi:hypothetical protein